MNGKVGAGKKEQIGSRQIFKIGAGQEEGLIIAEKMMGDVYIKFLHLNIRGSSCEVF